MTGEATPPLRGALRILVLTGEAERSALSDPLSEAGYAVDVTDTSAWMTDRIAVDPYDLVLLDVRSDSPSPIDAVKRLRTAEKEAGQEHIPVVAIAPPAAGTDALLDAGVDDLLIRPFRDEDLRQVVARRIDRRPVILVADDAPESHALVSAYLEGLGYRLALVSDGREAVEAFTTRRISLILMDMDMPVMNGSEATMAIRTIEEGADVPIIAMTGSEGWEARERCEKAGCTGYLTKPVEYSTLLKVVAAHLAGSVRGASDPAQSPERAAGPAGVETDGGAQTGSPITLNVDEVIADLVPGYLEARRENVRTMRRQLADGDYRSIESLAHRMKGSGEGYGLPEITRFGRRLELTAQKADAEALAEVIDALEGYLRRIVIRPPAD